MKRTLISHCARAEAHGRLCGNRIAIQHANATYEAFIPTRSISGVATERLQHTVAKRSSCSKLNRVQYLREFGTADKKSLEIKQREVEVLTSDWISRGNEPDILNSREASVQHKPVVDLIDQETFDVLMQYLLYPSLPSNREKSIHELWHRYMTPRLVNVGSSARSVSNGTRYMSFITRGDKSRLVALLMCASRWSGDLLWTLWAMMRSAESSSKAYIQYELLTEVIDGLLGRDMLLIAGEFLARILSEAVNESMPITADLYRDIRPEYIKRVQKSVSSVLRAIKLERAQALRAKIKPSYSLLHFLSSLDTQAEPVNDVLNQMLSKGARFLLVECIPPNLRIDVLCELARLQQPLDAPEFNGLMLSCLSGVVSDTNVEIVLELMDAHTFAVEVYGWLIAALIRRRRDADAKKVFRWLEQLQTYDPTLALQRRYFNTLLGASVEVGDWEYTITMFGTIMEKLKDAASTPESERSAAEIELMANPPDSKTYTILFNGVKLHGKIDVARRIIKLMDDVGAEIDSITATNYIDLVGQTYGVEAMLREYIRVFGPYPLKETGMYSYADEKTKEEHFGGTEGVAPGTSEAEETDIDPTDLPWIRSPSNAKPTPLTIVLMVQVIASSTEYIPHLETLLSNVLNFARMYGVYTLQGYEIDTRGGLNAPRRDKVQMSDFTQRVRRIVRNRIYELRRSRYSV
ncbi:hypothetical protein V1512DRAFT_261672 [Lipomyces arxii]|uniref:uncharacterized protein n=1 Tax=Lipomyces arxii TaxID=56418 RepID=UPI0034CF469F